MKSVLALRTLVLLAALGSLAVYVLFVMPQLQGTTFDDAFMFLRYAKHWLAGDGFCWNLGDGPAYGITSLTHLVLVTATRAWTPLPDPLVLTSISFLAGLAAAAVLTITGFVFFENLRRYWLPLLVIPCLTLGQMFTYHSTTGMETTLSLLCNGLFVAGLLWFVRKQTLSSLLLCAGAAYLSYLTRPDNGIYCLLLPPLFLLAGNRNLWKTAGVYIVVFLLLLAMDLVLKRVLFGSFFPLPFYVKSTGLYYRGYLGGYKWNAVNYMILFFREALPYLLLTVLFITRRSLLKIIAVLVPLVLTFIYFAGVTQIMGYDARYYFPSLPFLILTAFLSADSFLGESRNIPRNRNIFVLRSILALLLLTVLSSHVIQRGLRHVWQERMIKAPVEYSSVRQYIPEDRQPLPELGWWEGILAMDELLGRLPEDIIFASSEYGYIGARHPAMTMVDLAGLHDKRIAGNGFSIEYVLARKPDIIWLPHSDYTFMVKSILDSTTFVRNYDFYPGAYDYGLAVRKNSPHADRINLTLEQEFSRIYPRHSLSTRKARPQQVPQAAADTDK